MLSKNAELRRRTSNGGRQRNYKAESKEHHQEREKRNAKSSLTTSTPNLPRKSQETLGQTLKSHPLILILPLVLLGYALYRSYYFLMLQRPDLLNLRHAVGLEEPRQLLIVGTMSSGTTQVAADLSSQLGLEVAHEASDTKWYFARDGTVSWFHVWRFLEPPMDRHTWVTSLKTLCGDYSKKMGYHPALFRSTSSCRDNGSWNTCWARECMAYLEREWGCALTSHTRGCETPFATTLFQMRHPLRTMESLIVKFCVSHNGDLENSSVFLPFWQIVQAMFPSANSWLSEDGEDHNRIPTCVEATAIYTLEYYTSIFEASMKNEHAIYAMYNVESTTPCEIAELAGFMDPSRLVYEPHGDRIRAICESRKDHPAKNLMVSTKHKVNKGYVSKLSVDSFRIGGSMRSPSDERLENSMKELITARAEHS
mmetsp:Transcript_21382/g.35379  ORF Transcript_21382/g.35379 Transcript_21382/m.35379 type:complete len:425 (-) Transcript_21382:109-1383(-)|eukprot:CAMPEP_0119011130 /NCGR_PEP_ID=MMETSP1176-20130426/5474_1 /TAXON_ID=265551 /ORGANISM="Synedropsis recta cf, Strain CCMP1620" /LENGTH=424 /DNA_ID=CAMNT_0006963907 /DNA_START=49 /DNA_END=1323 /DNA_ORIENTATION=-